MHSLKEGEGEERRGGKKKEEGRRKKGEEKEEREEEKEDEKEEEVVLVVVVVVVLVVVRTLSVLIVSRMCKALRESHLPIYLESPGISQKTNEGFGLQISP